jgi:hypothetical protein
VHFEFFVSKTTKIHSFKLVIKLTFTQVIVIIGANRVLVIDLVLNLCPRSFFAVNALSLARAITSI